MKDLPLVSVIMNCYNGEKYLTQAIDSVLAQKYQNWEIIFWDNQSTDRSAEIAKGYDDPRIKYIYAPSHTLLYEARNYAIEEASGEFIAFLDVDDWWSEDKLEKQVMLFADPDVGVVCSNFWVVSERKNSRWLYQKRPIPTGWVLNELLGRYDVGLLSLMIRRSAFNKLEAPCNPKYHIIGDFDLVIRLLKSWKLDCVQEPLAYYRAHDNNETGKHMTRHVNELNDWLRDMSAVKEISGCSNFDSVKTMATYIEVMEYLLAAKRKSALRVLRKMPLGRLKAKLILAFLLPTSWLKKLKN